MKIMRNITVAFSMFSQIPMPRVAWNDENMRYMLCAFPLIGVVIGLCLWAWTGVCILLGINMILFAAGMTLIPVAVTGGIHLDGFSDTVDALSSHAAPEKKREILKDPHAGAFAVIGVCVYLLIYFALCTELNMNGRSVLLLALMHILSRILSGLAVLCFPSNSAKGMLTAFKEASAKKRAAAILFIFLVFCAAGMLFADLLIGSAMILAAVISMIYLFIMSRSQFEGMSGDLAGYFLQISELAMLAMIVSVQLIR
jgi:adenosylcobinamide-GDP ribazoletransferase